MSIISQNPLSTEDGRAIQSIFEVIGKHTIDYINRLTDLSQYKEIRDEKYHVDVLDEFDILDISSNNIYKDEGDIYSSVIHIKCDEKDMILLRSVLYDSGGGPAFDKQIRYIINMLSDVFWESGIPPLLIDTPEKLHLKNLVINDKYIPYKYDVLPLEDDQYVTLPIKEFYPLVKSSLTPTNGIAIKIFLQISIKL